MRVSSYCNSSTIGFAEVQQNYSKLSNRMTFVQTRVCPLHIKTVLEANSAFICGMSSLQ